MTPLKFDPTYVQINQVEAAEILGISLEDLAQRRAFEQHCPKGFRDWTTFAPTTRFRLSDIYAYSEYVMNQAQPVSMELIEHHASQEDTLPVS